MRNGGEGNNEKVISCRVAVSEDREDKNLIGGDLKKEMIDDKTKHFQGFLIK